MKLIFATRASPLARWQTRWVIEALQAVHADLTCQEKVIVTQGDKSLDQPLPRIGGKGLFTRALENALLSGIAQCAVHSLKDLPTHPTGGLILGCIPPRAEVRDVLISRDGYTLQSLAGGAVVGTSSPRRAAQLLSARPDLNISPIRGNVDTRIQKALLGQYHAIVLAGAGVLRLGLETHITQWLPLDVMLPAPSQGALVVQCAGNDRATLSVLSALEDYPTRLAVTAERQFLHGLGGGCALPVAAHATVSGTPPIISLAGLVASPDGKEVIRISGEGGDPIELGNRLAQQVISQGAKDIMSLNRKGKRE